MNRQSWMFALAMVLGLGISSTLLAQPGPGGGGPGGGGPGGGFGGPGGFDPAQFRQMQLDNIRQSLNATDDEWKVMEPKITKILELQQQANAGGRGGFGRRGGGGPGGQGGPGGGRGFGGQPNPVQEKVAAVTTAVESNASDQELKQKMAVAREARDKARADLATARKDLLGILTTKQEAILFGMGIVE